jgi:GT2 family glycosyltransferase
MRLSIVIPTWNGRALLEACLNSLRAQTWRNFEIIISDDGSTDGTLAWLAKHFPEVVVVRSEENEGFVAAANRGIARALGDWVFLLNNDVTLAEDGLEKLMAAAEQGDAAMLAPLVLWTEDSRLVYSAGDRIGVNGRPESIGYRLARDTFVPSEHPFGVSGGYGLFRRDLLDAVGVLDPAFGAYFEDGDLCFRARWAGYEARLVPEALAWHVGSASISNRLWWRTKQCHRNHALLVIKNFSARLLIWNAGTLLAERWHQNLRLFQVARIEWGAVRALGFVAGAWLDLATRIPGALAQRRRIMRSRKISDRAMQALLNGIEYE